MRDGRLEKKMKLSMKWIGQNEQQLWSFHRIVSVTITPALPAHLFNLF